MIVGTPFVSRGELLTEGARSLGPPRIGVTAVQVRGCFARNLSADSACSIGRCQRLRHIIVSAVDDFSVLKVVLHLLLHEVHSYSLTSAVHLTTFYDTNS